MFISHYNGHELSQLDHCLLWITLATTYTSSEAPRDTAFTLTQSRRDS